MTFTIYVCLLRELGTKVVRHLETTLKEMQCLQLVVVSVADDASYSDGNVSSRAQVNFCCLDIYIYI